jgi:uncharacterized protein
VLDSLRDIFSGSLPWLLYALLLLVGVAGLFLNILGLPGLWLIVVAAIAYGWWFDFAYIGIKTIIALVILGGLAELVELFAGAAGSKSAGGTKRGMVGAIVGGLVGGILGTGLIPIPIVGTIVGSIAGCFGGAYLIEYAIENNHTNAAVVSYGAAKGRVYGLVAKSAFGVVMALLVAAMGLPIRWNDTPSTAPTVSPATPPASTIPSQTE